MATHTQISGPVTQQDYEKVIDSLFDVIAFLFIQYFTKYSFGSNTTVLSIFSLLPPIIRFKVLDYLYKKDPTNIFIIDKLVLAMLKAFDTEYATKWMNDNKNELLQLQVTMVNNCKTDIKPTNNCILDFPIFNMHNNMYDLCKCKISQLSREFKINGRLYTTFEDALKYYEENKSISSDAPQEIVEFIDLMDFSYLGRKSSKSVKSTSEL